MVRSIALMGWVVLAGCDPTPCRGVDAGAPFCIPDGGVGAAGQALTLEVSDLCSGGCGPNQVGCAVSRSGNTITLSVVGTACALPPGTVCGACAPKRLPCAVPPLEPGDYTIASPNQASRTLQVRDGGAAACAAPGDL